MNRVLKTEEVIDLAREWVESNASGIPGFFGAHLMGSLATMPRHEPFPRYKDVDFVIVMENPPTDLPEDISHQGLILEVGRVDVRQYRSPEMILSDPGLASNLAAPSILVDPTGMLSSLHMQVKKDYDRRQWVLARCEAEKATVRQGLAALQQAESPFEALWPILALFTVGLTGLVAVANLCPVTHRRSLILMKELLTPPGRTDLHEELLDLLGFASLSRTQVEGYLQHLAEAFDRAVQVTKTPVPFHFKLHSHVRPYIVDASQEMIEEGHHREAMGWILVFTLATTQALLADAPIMEKTYFQTKTDGILRTIGWDTLDEKANRLEKARLLAEKVFQIADEMVSQNPEVKE